MNVQGADQSVCAAEGHQNSGGASAVGHWSSPAHYCLLHLPDYLQCKVLPMHSTLQSAYLHAEHKLPSGLTLCS